MQWDIINTEPLIPKCNFCDRTTGQMARFHILQGHGLTFYICSSCARYVKDAMNKWKELKSTDWIEPDGPNIMDCKYIDKVIQENKDKAALFPEVDPDDEMKSLDDIDDKYKGESVVKTKPGRFKRLL